MAQYSDIYDNDELLRQVAFDEITKNLIKENDCNKRIDILSVTFDKLCPNQKIQSEVEKNAVALEVAMKKDPYSTIKAVQENDARVKAHGEVFTPLSLVRDMLAPLPDSVWRNPDLKWIDNSCGSGVFLSEIKRKLMLTLRKVITDPIERERHIVENMIYGVDIQASNVFYARKNVRGNSNFTPNIKYWNALEYNYWNGMKFDVVVGNPPYNDNEERKGTVNSLYDNFVYKFFEIANPDAYLVYVHPSKWREGDNPLGELMKSKKILFLEIHDAKDGKKVFKRDTRYDFYVLQNTDNDG
jgi:type I restriction-modification system DNA methylase subunit